MTQVYCVMGGWHYEGENMASLQLFDCKSTAEEYQKQIKDEYDYALIFTREVNMNSKFEEIKND